MHRRDFGGADGPIRRSIAAIGSRTAAGPAAAPRPAAAPLPAAARTTGRADRALFRCSVGAGTDRIDLSARSGDGGALVREESKPERRGSRRCDAKAAVGYERQGI